MLLAHFYTIISKTANAPMAWTVKVELNPQHNIYEGHFPDNPVLPGVCTLQIIKECAIELLDNDLQYVQINSCKYLSVINPVQSPALEFNITVKELEEQHTQLLAEGHTNDAEFIKLKAILIKK